MEATNTTAILAHTAITKNHKSIGQEFLQRVQGILYCEPEIKTYGIDDSSYWITEKIKLDVSGTELSIEIRQTK